MNKSVKYILWVHFCLLVIILLNWIIEITTVYNLSRLFEAIAKSLFVFTGLAFFFLNLKKIKSLSLYFYAFPFWTVLVSIGTFTKGMLGEMMIMLLLNPIWPNGLIAQYDDILIYDNSEGFMAMCCPYKVTERQYILFEKEVGEFQLIETLDPKKAIVKNSKDWVILIFSNKNGDEETVELQKHTD